jgi:outer membrane lipoprotein-sorting protein
MLALSVMVSPGRAQTNGQVMQEIAASLNSMRTMGGDFVQFGPNGEKSEGVFALDRPGKIHFRYDAPSKIQIMSDGKSVVIHDRALQTWDLWPLSKTPLRFLLTDRVDFLNDSKVKNIQVEADIVTVTMVEESMFGEGKVTLLFDRASNELRQWTVTDAQGLDTTVAVYNLKGGMDWNEDLFKIPYGRIAISERQ